MCSRKLVAGALVSTAILVAMVAAASIFRPDRAIRVATGYVAHNVCSKSFRLAGSIRKRYSAETTDRAGIRRLRWGLSYRLDRTGQKRRCVAGRVCSAAMPFFTKGSAACCCTDRKQPYLLRSDIAALKTPKTPPLLAENCRSGRGRAGRSRAEGRARSCLRGAGGAAVPQNQGGRRGARRPGDRRTLCRRHRRRYAATRLLHDQIGDQRADRNSDPARRGNAVVSGADTGMAGGVRPAPRDRGRASDADDHGSCAR